MNSSLKNVEFCHHLLILTSPHFHFWAIYPFKCGNDDPMLLKLEKKMHRIKYSPTLLFL